MAEDKKWVPKSCPIRPHMVGKMAPAAAVIVQACAAILSSREAQKLTTDELRDGLEGAVTSSRSSSVP